MDISELENQVNEYIKNSKEKEAVTIAEKELNNNIDDFDKLVKLKRIFKKMGSVANFLKTCNLIIRLNPREKETLKDLSEIYYNQGKDKNYLKIMHKLIRNFSNDKEIYIELARFYKDRKQFDKMKETLIQGKERTDDPIFNKMINAREKERHKIDSSDLQKYSDNVVLELLNLFKGRENVYARQWKNERDEIGYIPVHEPLNFNAIKNHLNGNMTVGIYPITLSNKTKIIALDIDALKYTHKKMLEESEYRKFLFRKMQPVIKKLREFLHEFEIESYTEFSGFKGYHLWIFLKNHITAEKAFEFSKKLALVPDLENKPIHIENFPKQKRVHPQKLGNLIKLPLGIHLKTGLKSFFVDSDFKKIKDNQFAAEIKQVDPEKILKALNYLNKTQPDLPHKEKVVPEPEEIDIDQVDKEFYKIKNSDFKLENNNDYNILITKCYALRTIVEKIETSYEITNQERLALVYSLGHLENGAKIVNELLQKCINVTPDKYMKSPFRGNPVSCPKIRQRLKNLIDPAKCNCKFSNLLNSYPNPLLHLESDSDTLSIKHDRLKLKFIVENYLHLKKSFNETKEKLEKQEKRLLAVIEETGVEIINTSFGKIKVAKKDGKLNLTLDL